MEESFGELQDGVQEINISTQQAVDVLEDIYMEREEERYVDSDDEEPAPAGYFGPGGLDISDLSVDSPQKLEIRIGLLRFSEENSMEDMQAQGQDPKHIAEKLYEHGNACHLEQDYDKSLALHTQSLSLRRETYGTDAANEAIADSLHAVGSVHYRLLDCETSRKYHEAALIMRKKLFGTVVHADMATSLYAMGLVCNSEGDTTGARMYHEQALAMKRQLHAGGGERGDEPLSPSIASSLHELGSVCLNEGDIRGARSYHEQSLAMKMLLNPGNAVLPEIATSYHALGGVSECEGDFERARAYYEKSIEMNKEVHLLRMKAKEDGEKEGGGEEEQEGEEGQEQEDSDGGDGGGAAATEGSAHAEAKAKGKFALDYGAAQRHSGTYMGDEVAHPDIALVSGEGGVTLHCLGKLMYHQKNYDEAKTYHERSLAMMRRVCGPGVPHRDIAASLHELGNVMGGMVDYKEACRYNTLALEMKRQFFGEESLHPDISLSHHNLAFCEKECTDFDAAEGHARDGLALEEEAGRRDSETAVALRRLIQNIKIKRERANGGRQGQGQGQSKAVTRAGGGAGSSQRERLRKKLQEKKRQQQKQQQKKQEQSQLSSVEARMARMAALVNLSGEQQSRVSAPKLAEAGDAGLSGVEFHMGAGNGGTGTGGKKKKKKKKKKNGGQGQGAQDNFGLQEQADGKEAMEKQLDSIYDW